MGLIAFVVTDRLQPRSHRPRAHCSSTGSKSRTHQESALQLDLGRLVETCSLATDTGARKSSTLPPAYHAYKKATARNAPIAVAQVALHEKEPLHEPRKSGARLFTKGFNANQAIAGKPDLEGSRQPLGRKPAQLDAATRRSRLTSANRFWQNQYPPFEDSPAVESQAGGEVGLLSVVTSL